MAHEIENKVRENLGVPVLPALPAKSVAAATDVEAPTTKKAAKAAAEMKEA